MNSSPPQTDPFRSRGLRRRVLLLLPLLAALFAAALWRLQLTYDLAFFLPAPQSIEQQILVDRLGQGPGAELIFVQLPQASAQRLEGLASTLTQSGAFATVWPDSSIEPALLPEVLHRNRLLLGNLPDNSAQWLAVLEERLFDLRTAPDSAVFDAVAADPALLALNALQQLQGDFDPQALRTPDSPLLILRSKAAAFDMDAMADTHALLQQTLAEHGIVNAQLFGSGIYGVELQHSVRRESMAFSAIAGFALAALVLWRFRSLTALFASALPLLVGAAGGLAILTLLGGTVHGITLAFGFTLLGVAIDYPLHLFSHHTVAPGASTQRMWRTLRLGVVSTLLAYGAFLLSGAGGLLQLGLFAGIGVAGAALATGYLSGGLRDLSAQPADAHAEFESKGATAPAGNLVDRPSASVSLTHGPWLLCLAVSLPFLLASNPFNDDLSTLTPVPAATLKADSELRASLGTVDLRHLISVGGSTREQALQNTEATVAILQRARNQGLISGFQSVTSLLPSLSVQQQRRAALSAQRSERWLEQAVAQSTFRTGAFDAFTQHMAWEQQRKDWLTAQALQDDPVLADLLSGQLHASSDGWRSLVYLRGLEQPAQLSQLLSAHPEAALVDLKAASISLVSDYRARLLTVLGFAALAVTLLLWLRTGDLRRSLWLLGTVLAAVTVAALANLLLAEALSLFDLMALALVAGLGLDYALFYSRPDPNAIEQQATPRAVNICAASSMLVFGILSLSSIPLLNSIGTTVAVGVVTAYLLARTGRYAKPAA